MVWFHATSDQRIAALLDLADRLSAHRPSTPVLLTFDRRLVTGPRPARHDGHLYEIPLDGDHPGAAEVFVHHWRPMVGLWAGGALMPNLLASAQARDVPLILTDIDEAGLRREGLPWLPDPERAVLRTFRRAFALDIATFSRLQRAGIPPQNLQVAPRLQDSLAPPPAAEEDLSETGEMLTGRPVWFAAGLCASEAVGVLTAHRQAVRLSHRLLLVISPSASFDASKLQALLDGAGLRYLDWEPGDPIDEFVQVLVAREPDSPALWFRLAPISLMGGTLGPEEEPSIHPFIPAALGSAVLHGSQTSPHSDAYDRLAQAGGAQIVQGSSHLGEVVLRLIQPEDSARMALAGWDVVTEGAWLIDRLCELIQDFCDAAEMRDATT